MKIFKTPQLVFITVTLCCICLQACTQPTQSFFYTMAQTRKIVVSLPAIPEKTGQTFAFTAWDIKIVSSDGRNENFEISVAAQNFELTIPKNHITVIQAKPLQANVSFFYPAGTIAPFETDLNWQDGFESEIALTLLASSTQTSSLPSLFYFNWNKLTSSLREFENPWCLNREKLVADILMQKITPYSFSLNPTTEMQLNLPLEDGNLYSPYILQKPFGQGDTILLPAEGHKRTKFLSSTGKIIFLGGS